MIHLLKAFTIDELYGYFDEGNNDWVDGLVANIMRNFNASNENEVNFCFCYLSHLIMFVLFTFILFVCIKQIKCLL